MSANLIENDLDSTQSQPLQSTNRYTVSIATTTIELEKCFALRYQIFSNEMGAKINSDRQLDQDRFDPHCTHLMVSDNHSGEVIATSRLLSDEDTVMTGSFYSETEFDLSNILNMNGHFIEVGRTCIHKDFRKGAVLALLWQGIARIVALGEVDYLIGCASIPLHTGDTYISTVLQHLRTNNFSDPDMRVRPLLPLPELEAGHSDDVILPALLKGYLRQGAVICGEPYWDAAFGVADVFVLLDCDKIAARYMQHFVDRMRA